MAVLALYLRYSKFSQNLQFLNNATHTDISKNKELKTKSPTNFMRSIMRSIMHMYFMPPTWILLSSGSDAHSLTEELIIYVGNLRLINYCKKIAICKKINE